MLEQRPVYTVNNIVGTGSIERSGGETIRWKAGFNQGDQTAYYFDYSFAIATYMAIDHNPSIVGAVGLTAANTSENPTTSPGTYAICENSKLFVCLPDGSKQLMFALPDEPSGELLRITVAANGSRAIIFLHAHSFLRADMKISAPWSAGSVRPFFYVKTNGAQLGWLSTRKTLLYS